VNPKEHYNAIITQSENMYDEIEKKRRGRQWRERT